MRKRRKTAGYLLAIVAAALCLAVAVAAETDPLSVIGEGTCGGEGDGSNLTWVLTSDGELTIRGTGEMDNYGRYDWENQPPWKENRDKITKVTIEYGVTCIGAYVFYEDAVKTLTIPESVTKIGSCAFIGCALESLEIPGSVTVIGDCSFDRCLNLRSVTIPNGVVRIAHAAFSRTALEEVEIPESVNSIAGYAFSQCVKLRRFLVAEGNRVYSAIDGVLFRGQELVSYPNAHGSVYEVPEGTTTLGYASFRGCADLEKLTLPDSLKTIGGESISECPSLNSLTIPDSVTRIGNYAFFRSGLTSIRLPAGLTDWPSYSPFSECKSLETITVAAQCEVVKTVDNVLYSGDGTKLLCYPLGRQDTSFTIPEGVKSIGKNAFEDCETLEHVSFPDGLEEIEFFAFHSCRLKEALLPDSLKNIAMDAFMDCKSLCELRLPETMETIGAYAFLGTAVESLTVPSGLGKIGVQMFCRMYQLRRIVIPADVTSIEAGAFNLCYSLRDVYFRGTEEQWNAMPIDKMNNEDFFWAAVHWIGSGPVPELKPAPDFDFQKVYSSTTSTGSTITKANVGAVKLVGINFSFRSDTAKEATFAVAFYDQDRRFLGMGMDTRRYSPGVAINRGAMVPVDGFADAEYIRAMILGDDLTPVVPARELHLTDE